MRVEGVLGGSDEILKGIAGKLGLDLEDNRRITRFFEAEK